ncbi:unnamed protein product [Effrenium voratum]|nr:unnamed protein product [Effrenium voratum]
MARKEDPERDAPQALDLSSGRFTREPRFECLKVLLVSGQPLVTEDLAEVLRRAPNLWKLDASYCGLNALPEGPELWQRMLNMKSLLLHVNHLAKWQDVELAASPPNLEWLSMYGNPITSQPEYQSHVLGIASSLVALDLRVLTDQEHSRRAATAPGSFRRFAANSEASSFLFRAKPCADPLPPQELLQEAADELRQLYIKSAYCSAAFAIQGCWRVYKARSVKVRLSQTRQRSAIMLQKCARKFLWKRQMQTYVQNFLAEEEGLDLLLNAKEMLTLRASKLIESSVRRWVRRRKERRTVRQAATVIARNVKGYLTRCKLLRKFLELDEYRRIYFPASFTWEAIVLLNVARAACDMPPLPREHRFEAADVMAIRLVDSSEMPRMKSEVSRLLAFRNFSLLRPCHSGRYPSHLWDGPFHRLVAGGASERICQAYQKVRRRAANVDNICRKVFLASCACGPHPIQGAPYEEGPFVVRQPRASRGGPDFRELYHFDKLLGEGDFGIVYTCEVRPGPAWDEEMREPPSVDEDIDSGDQESPNLVQLLAERRRQQRVERRQREQRTVDQTTPDVPASGLVVKLVDHGTSWWGNLAASSLHESQRCQSWLLLSQEVKKLSQLSHPNLIKTHTVFVDDYFVYFVISRFTCSLRIAVLAAGKFSRRGLPVPVAADVAVQLLSPLAYLHAHRVVHRGITPDNLVVNTPDLLRESFQLVIADLYSTARTFEAGAFLGEVIGSPEYWAPEVAECEYSCAADVWAAGVVLWFAQTKRLPFNSLHSVLTRDVEPNVRISHEVFESMACMLCREVPKRVTAEEALRDDWLRESLQGPSVSQSRRGAVTPAGYAGGKVLQETDDRDSDEESDPPSGASSVVFPTREINPIPERNASKKRLLRRKSITDLRQLSNKQREEPSNWGRPTRAARRLPEKKRRADERFAMGEKVTVSFEAAIQRCQDSAGGSLQPFVSYEWWSEERCRRLGLEMNDVPLASWWQPRPEGLSYVCPASADDLGKILEEIAPDMLRASRTSSPAQNWDDVLLSPYYFKGTSALTDKLFKQLRDGRCRLCVENGRLCRVVDLLVLRVKSASGKYLVGGERMFSSMESREEAIAKMRDLEESDSDEQGTLVGSARITAAQVMVLNLEEQRAKPKKEVQEENPLEMRRYWRFPTVERPLGGLGVGRCGGLDELRQALDALIAEQLRAKPEALRVFDSAASVEVACEQSESVEFPGILDLRRRHYFDALVNEDAGRSKLSQIGIPGEKPFRTSFLPAEDIQWCWAEESECEKLGVQVHVEPIQDDPVLWNFRAIPAKQLRGKPLEELLAKYGFLRSNAAVSEKPLRTVARFAGEVARGQLRLWERKSARDRRPSQLSPGFSRDGGELLLLEEVLMLRVRSAKGNFLVSARQFIEGEANKWNLFGTRTATDSCFFPEVKLKNGEDPVVATHRTIREHLHLSQAMPTCIHFGQRKLEEQRAQQKGLAKLIVRQVVDVQLGEPDVGMLCCLMMPGMDKEAEALGVYLQRLRPRGDEEEVAVDAMMQELVEGADCPVAQAVQSEADSPPAREAQLAAQVSEKDPTLMRFLHEAWRLGSRPRKEDGKPIAQHDPATGKKIYRDATWLSQPLVSCCCETPRLAERFILFMLHFAGTGGDAPLVRPVPFLPERFVKQAAAALCVQAAWRAHRERCSLSCNLRTAATLRRCALCIQRCWRWSLLKRRLELLQGAARAARRVRGVSLYIEERLLIALNLINSVNRYPPLLCESSHCFAANTEDEIVLVVHPPKHSSWKRVKEPKEAKAARRAAMGLPHWLCEAIGGQRSTSAEQQQPLSTSSGVPGLYGLLLQGIAEPRESDFITVPMPSLEHQARLKPNGLQTSGEVNDPALLASRGVLRWAELRFKSVEQARRRAAILFLCSWSALHREAVPIVPKSMIQNTEVGAAVLRFWKVYGLTWAVGEKTSTYKLRNLAMKHLNTVSLNGRESWSFVMRQEWLGMDRTGPLLSEKTITVKEAFAGNKWGVSSSGLTGSGSPVPLRGAKGRGMLPPLPPTRPGSEASARTPRNSGATSPTSWHGGSPRTSPRVSPASPRASHELRRIWGDLGEAFRRTPPVPPWSPAPQSARRKAASPSLTPRTR